jgi:hypothetical protein
LFGMPAGRASIPVMGLKIGKRFRSKKESPHFLLLEPLSNYTKQSNLPILALCPWENRDICEIRARETFQHG